VMHGPSWGMAAARRSRCSTSGLPSCIRRSGEGERRVRLAGDPEINSVRTSPDPPDQERPDESGPTRSRASRQVWTHHINSVQTCLDPPDQERPDMSGSTGSTASRQVWTCRIVSGRFCAGSVLTCLGLGIRRCRELHVAATDRAPVRASR
jgi:hypothetical protein